MMMKGGLAQPKIKYVTLFDTGANPFNYIYLYYIHQIKDKVPSDFFWIDEPVYLGDKSQQNIYLAVGIKVSFIDPLNKDKINCRKVIFKVFRNLEPPENDTNPLILGLQDICEHFVDILVNALKYNYRKRGKTYEGDAKQLRIRSFQLPEDEALVTLKFISSYNIIGPPNVEDPSLEEQPTVLSITNGSQEIQEQESVDLNFINKLYDVLKGRKVLFRKNGHVYSTPTSKVKPTQDKGYKLFLRRLPLNKKVTTNYSSYLQKQKELESSQGKESDSLFRLDETIEGL